MNAMVWAVLLPFLGAVVCLPMRGRVVYPLGSAASLCTLGVCIHLWIHVWTQGPGRLELGGWPVPLGIALQLDGLGVLFLLMTAVVGVLVGFYAGSYFARNPEHREMEARFWPMWLLLWGGLNGLYLSSDVFNAYVLLEITGLAAVGLTVLSGSTTSLVAGLRYLLAAMFGSLMYLLGVALLYSAVGQLDYFALGREVTPRVSVLAAFGLMVFGLLLKTALLPFHFWLPPAHSSAPAPVSAVLSALVVKGSFFLLLRVWFVVFESLSLHAVGHWGAQLLACMGALAVIWGSFQAVRQSRLKPMVAYSTVGQLGYLFFLFALLADPRWESWAAMAWTGTVFHVFSHALAKAALFLAVGCLMLAMGTDELNAMRNIAGRMPQVTFALGVAGVSLMGLPPSGGFVAKWMLLKAALTAGQWWWAPVIVLGGLLTAAYVFKILSFTFVPSQGEGSRLEPVPRMMVFASLALAVLCVLMGFRAEEIIALLPPNSDLGAAGAWGGGEP